MKNKKLDCFVFSIARSDYGILRNLILNLEFNKSINSKLILLGAHHSNIFGNTKTEAIKDKIKEKKNLNINLYSRKQDPTIMIFSKIMIEIEKLLLKSKPKFVILLGDRYETLAVSLACFMKNIPIVHFCGGSVTKGSLDDKYRYSISNISDTHIVETAEHKKKLINNNINSKDIFISGAPALENIRKIKFKSRENFLKDLKIKNIKKQKIIVGTFHPETTKSVQENKKNLVKLLRFFNTLSHIIIFTYPNSDSGYFEYIKILKDNINYNKNYYLFKNLGILKYYKLLKISDVMMGNSSGGIIETSAFKLPTINIGDRQKGRSFSKNVIHSTFEKKDLNNKLNYCFTRKFKKIILNSKNIYELKMDSKMIIKILSNIYLNNNI